MATIEIDGFDAVQRLLAGLSGRGIEKVMQGAAIKIGEKLRLRLRIYPGPSNSPVLWMNDDQRKAYFASRYNKETKTRLSDKYTRLKDKMSQKLKDSWEVVPWGDSGAIVGTRVTYAPYVQGEANRQPQHMATGWETEYDAIQNLKSRNVVERVVMAELDSYVKGLK
jgi:hypothetical protein